MPTTWHLEGKFQLHGDVKAKVAWSTALGTPLPAPRFLNALDTTKRNKAMRGVLLWVLGIPIPIIILLYLFHVI